MLKSIAVVAGSYVLSVVLVLATDPLLSRLFPGDFVKGHVPSGAALLASTALFVVVSILCAWLCARLTSWRASRHVLWFFIVGEVMGIAAIIPNWSKGWPHWYWLSWLLTWPVSCWIGLRLAGREANSPVA
jgi:O-antigen/teichoic acid export membrane protein